ncbi:hypothetical protein GCM10027215_39970 [Nocardioides zeae]
MLARHFFEQFPSQRSIPGEIARTILLFGSAAELPLGFAPEAMTPGWFEGITDGLTLDEYVESLFLISTMTQQHNGGFSQRLAQRARLGRPQRGDPVRCSPAHVHRAPRHHRG